MRVDRQQLGTETLDYLAGETGTHQLVKDPRLKTTGRQDQSADVQQSEVHGRIRVTSSNPKLQKDSWAIQFPRAAVPHAPQPQLRL